MSTHTGFHEGELAVQQRAGVRAEAARLSGMLDPTELSDGAARFLSQREFAVLTARDRSGRLWVSPLTGAAGFLDGHDTELVVRTAPAATDPLDQLMPGQPVGLIAIDFATRRRMRINGTLVPAGPQSLRIDVEQAYGNCPQHINRRQLRHSTRTDSHSPRPEGGRTSNTLGAGQRRIIEDADTFFLGTIHPTRGADASHRGGPSGFIRVEGSEVTWPDYPGNNMFNSLGNLASHDTAALLFIDFATGATLHLSGIATVEWAPPDPVNLLDTGRSVRFTIHDIVDGITLGVTAKS